MSPPRKYRRLPDSEGLRKMCSQSPKTLPQESPNQPQESSTSSSSLNLSDFSPIASSSRPPTSSTRPATSTSEAATVPSRGSIFGHFTTASSSASEPKAERDSKAQRYKDSIWNPTKKVASANPNAGNDDGKTAEQQRQETLDRLNETENVERRETAETREDGAAPAPRDVERKEKKKKKKRRNPFKITWESFFGWIERDSRDKSLDSPRQRGRRNHSGQSPNAGTSAFYGGGTC